MTAACLLALGATARGQLGNTTETCAATYGTHIEHADIGRDFKQRSGEDVRVFRRTYIKRGYDVTIIFIEGHAEAVVYHPRFGNKIYAEERDTFLAENVEFSDWKEVSGHWERQDGHAFAKQLTRDGAEHFIVFSVVYLQARGESLEDEPFE